MSGDKLGRTPGFHRSASGKKHKRADDPFRSSSKPKRTKHRSRTPGFGSSAVPTVKSEHHMPSPRVPLSAPAIVVANPGLSSAGPKRGSESVRLRSNIAGSATTDSGHAVKRPRRSVAFTEDTVDNERAAKLKTQLSETDLLYEADDDGDEYSTYSEFKDSEFESAESNTEDQPTLDKEGPAMAGTGVQTRSTRATSRKRSAHLSMNDAFDYEAENPSVRMANRTMCGIVYERDADITRRIILNGDIRRDYLNEDKAEGRWWSSDVISWPAVDIHKYLNYLQPDTYKPIGVEPLRSCESRCEHVSLEEPGAEWDARQLRLLSEATDEAAGEESGGDADEDVGYTGGLPAFTDGTEISDSTRNGGIGLVIKRQQQQDDLELSNTDDIQFITKQQILHPELLAPRYNRVPLLDELRNGSFNQPSPHFHQLLELTRVQVLNQAMASAIARPQPLPQSLESGDAGSNTPEAPLLSQVPFPLSRFVSTTVAEEAVSGIAKTWSMVRDIWDLDKRKPRKGRSRRILRPGIHSSGWITILEAALLAGLPIDVVARSYRRLEKLCDVPTQIESRRISTKFSHVEFPFYRKYRPELQRTQAGEHNPRFVHEHFSSDACSEAESDA
ncbi:hypothetical protein GQ54DRAFT_175261 [Martensiomyces pterosporus]|nr:hypothetical protein GQ54DRAFT_175261 [Martensiomyces pterosporus]